MHPQTKKLLIDSIGAFQLVPPDQRECKINFIKKQLGLVDNPNAFFEPSKEYVDAGLIFLRIHHKIPYTL